MRGLPKGREKHLPKPKRRSAYQLNRRFVPIRYGPRRGAAEPGAVPGCQPPRLAIIEPVACAYNGRKLAGMSRAETALIVGCGPLGLNPYGLAKSLGVQKVAAVDPIAQTANDGHAFRSGSGLGAWRGAAIS